MIGQLTNDEIDEVLKSNVLGRIGCVEDGKIYVVPINYLHDGTSIIAYSAEGMKIRVMEKNPSVCFEVDEMKSFTNWKMVIAWGRYEEITEEQEKYEAMKIFVDRMMHLKISETARPPEMSEKRVHPRSPGNIKLVVFRIRIADKSGRFENEEV